MPDEDDTSSIADSAEGWISRCDSEESMEDMHIQEPDYATVYNF